MIFRQSEMVDDNQTYLSSWFDSLRFSFNRGRGHLFRFLLNRIQWHIYPRFQVLPKFPEHVDIELSSACNMKCPMCFTTTETFKTSVKMAVMKFDLFKKIIDECVEHGTFSIRMSWRGEPTLNPHFIDMARFAKERGIREVSSLTNALALTPAMFETLVDIEFDWLTISFDGVGETYNRIRAPAKFDDAVAKIREFAAIKKRKGRIKPVVRIQSVWPAIKDDPKAFYDAFHGIVDHVAVNPLVDYLRADTDIVYRDRFVCPVLWQRLAVGADGQVSLCVHDEMSHHIIGDVRSQTIFEIWNGEPLRQARQSHRAHEGVQKFRACAECFLPRAIQPVASTVDGRGVVIQSMINRPDIVGG